MLMMSADRDMVVAWPNFLPAREAEESRKASTTDGRKGESSKESTTAGTHETP